jgi:hypothetical protein
MSDAALLIAATTTSTAASPKRTRPEAIHRLKRYIARETYSLIATPQPELQPSAV